jgi:hypothetical protein
MSKSYILKGTENEYLLVIRAEDEKAIHKIIDYLSSSRIAEIKEMAAELEKSLNDDGNRRNSGKTGSKNKSKGTDSNNSKSRKTKDS